MEKSQFPKTNRKLFEKIKLFKHILLKSRKIMIPGKRVSLKKIRQGVPWLAILVNPDSKKVNPDSKKVNPDSKKVNPALRR